MFHLEDFISGEKFQELCDVYCGFDEDFKYNPRIESQTNKFIHLESLTSEWNNPQLLFCYSHRLHVFQEKVHLLKNPFVLVSHNEDTNITDTFIPLLEHPLLIKWFAQNQMILHPKLHWLPIAIANTMWPHGNLDCLQYVLSFQESIPKTNDFYFFFSVYTNEPIRSSCKEVLSQKGLWFGEKQNYMSYLHNLSTHKFCIAPPGNGVDCHRIWECLYFGVVPILLRSRFTEIISQYFPCVLLNSWNDFDKEEILKNYNPDWIQKIQQSPFLNIQHWKSIISEAIPHT